jgi:hypothetical protein
VTSRDEDGQGRSANQTGMSISWNTRDQFGVILLVHECDHVTFTMRLTVNELKL